MIDWNRCISRQLNKSLKILNLFFYCYHAIIHNALISNMSSCFFIKMTTKTNLTIFVNELRKRHLLGKHSRRRWTSRLFVIEAARTVANNRRRIVSIEYGFPTLETGFTVDSMCHICCWNVNILSCAIMQLLNNRSYGLTRDENKQPEYVESISPTLQWLRRNIILKGEKNMMKSDVVEMSVYDAVWRYRIILVTILKTESNAIFKKITNINKR